MSTIKYQQAIAEVTLELQEMKKLGLRVPFDPAALSDQQKADIVECHDGGMKISEVADLLINLSR